jgi:enamine deaminase RidA (YjgF/YER057c/UK114 family)
MNRAVNPGSIAKPISAYSHGMEVPPNARWLTVSGQIGVDADGNLGADVAEQSALVWKNILAILHDAGMEVRDIVKMNAYLLSANDVGAYGAARTECLGDHRPASTLVYVSALATPAVQVEVEVIAARAS